jgi:DMSO/TMAO reductase YedYZ molybdopterin-dependent catalytic subunit
VRAGLSGVAAAALGLGVAEVIAVATGPLSAPLLAVGGVVIDTVPGPVKNFGVAVFGVHDKTALITGTAVLLAAYAYGLGVVAVRHWGLALGGIALFGLIGAAAAITRHDAGPLAALPSLIGAALAIPVLRYLLSLATAAEAPTPPASRRDAAASGRDAAASGRDAAATVVDHGVIPDRTSAQAQDRGYGVPGIDVDHGDSADRAGIAPAQAHDRGAGDRGATARTTTGGGTIGSLAEDGTPGALERPGVAVASVDAEPAYVQESRRRFLRSLGIVAGVAVVSGVGGRLLTSRRAVTAARSGVALPAAGPAPALPKDVQAPGAVAYVTPNADFYRIDTSLFPPQVDPATWHLRIFGRVRNPITIRWDDLLRRPMVQRYVTLACVSNEVGGDLISNALWLGTPIKALLDEVQPLPDADQVVQRSVDGWTCGTPTAVLRDGRDALLAIGMNGQPLPIEHGFPVRMVVPGLYGYVSACKWIYEIELTRFADFDAYWVPRGWSQQAPIKTQSRIDTPRDGARKKTGDVVVAGVAWAQHRGISKVEVQVDGGPWAAATLAGAVSADTWRQWWYRWPATPGQHTLRVRATDATGQTQTDKQAPPDPNGATGWHSVQVSIE